MSDEEKHQIIMDWLHEKAQELHAELTVAEYDCNSPEVNRLIGELNVGKRWFDELTERSIRDQSIEQNRATLRLEYWKALVS